MRNELRLIGMVLFVTILSYAQAARGAGNTDLGNGFVNVTAAPYSAPTTTGTTCNVLNDATAKIQQAIDDVASGGGGTVYLPAGRYCILTHLVLKSYTTLRGVFSAPPTAYPIPTNGPTGTTLLAVENAGAPGGTSFITMLEPGSGLNGLAVWYPNQTVPTTGSWTPIQYPWTINVVTNDVSLQNLLLLNPHRAINLDYAGRHFIKGIYGQPILNGMFVDHIYDVGRISDVHFWPFWTENAAVMNFVQNNAIAFIFHRSDWQLAENIFTLGYKIGMAFDLNPASPPEGGGTNASMNNIGFDGAQYGIVLYGTPEYGVNITNLNVALTSPNPSYAIANYSGAGRASALTVTNASIWGDPTSSVTWAGDGLLMLSNTRIKNTRTTSPAISITAGQAQISGTTFQSNQLTGVGISVGPSAGKVFIGGNMMFGKTIQNLGTSTTIGTNSP